MSTNKIKKMKYEGALIAGILIGTITFLICISSKQIPEIKISFKNSYEDSIHANLIRVD